MRLRAAGGGYLDRFRALAPERPSVPIQVWSVRRVGLTAAVLAGALAAVAAVAAYIQVAGLV